MSIVNGKIITLNQQEISEAMLNGIDWVVRCILRGSKPRSAFKTPVEQVYKNIIGAIGQRALNEYLGIPWKPMVDVYTRIPDVGKMEARTRTENHYALLVRPDDSDDRPYALIIGLIYRFKVVGWMYGRDCKQERWLCRHGGGEPAYFVPQIELNPDFSRWKNGRSGLQAGDDQSQNRKGEQDVTH